MRINRFLALATGISRRSADTAIEADQVKINGKTARLGQPVTDTDTVIYNGKILKIDTTAIDKPQTILLNKPAGYVCSRNGQGSHTIYELLPKELHRLKPVGRLDKDSSGLLLLTSDGELAHRLTHPSFKKEKVYEVTLDVPLQLSHQRTIAEQGVMLDDGLSRFALKQLHERGNIAWKVVMHEGRNRQIRRTFAALGYTVRTLHRTTFGPYMLNNLRPGEYTQI